MRLSAFLATVCGGVLALGPPAEAGAPAAYRCQVKVLDSSERPVAGAVVELHSSPAIERAEGSAALPFERRVVDGEGVASFMVTNQAICTIVASKPGSSLAWGLWYPGLGNFGLDDDSLELTLTPPAAVAGTVRNQKGEPVADASVWVSAASCSFSGRGGGNRQAWAPLRSKLGRQYLAARTGADGRFRIERLPGDANVDLDAKKPGLVLDQPLEAVINAPNLNFNAGDSNIVLTLKPAGAIEGRVLRVDNQAPLPGARVSLRHSPWYGEAEPTLATQSDGIFRLIDLSAGEHALRAIIGTNQFSEWVCESITVDVEAGKTNRDVRILASSGGVLEVTVREEPRGVPVDSATISVSGGMEESLITCSDQGVGRLRLVPGEYYLFAAKPGLGNEQTQATVELDRTNQVTITLKPAANLSGTVLDPEGKPVPKVDLSIFPFMQQRRRTDSEGRFSFNPITNQGGGMRDQQRVLIARDMARNLAATLDLDEEATNATLHLAPGLTLAGRATDTNGKPITNAEAQLMFRTERMGTSFGNPVRADAEGRFEIKGLPRGQRYDVSVSAKGYGRRTISLTSEETDKARIELEPSQLPLANQRIAGTVVDADDKPIGGATVYCYGADQPNLNGRTDSKGHFSFNQVCAGTIQISANAGRGRGQNSYGNASAEAGDTNIVVQLGVSQNITTSGSQQKISGTVIDLEGKPAPKVKVSLFPSYSQGENQTDAQGCFKLSFDRNQMGGRPDSQPVLLARDLTRNLAVALDLEEEATNADLKLEPALTIAGRVTGVDGIAITSAQVSLLFWTGNMGSSLGEPIRVDAEGRFEIKGLPPGRRYGVNASAKGYGQESHNIEAADMETNRVELEPIELVVADRQIAGVVLDGNDKPVARANVYSYGDKQPNINIQTDAKGRFSLRPVCAGVIHLSVNTQSGGYANATAEGGDTNITVQLNASSGFRVAAPAPTTLKGKPLPDLTPLGLTAADLPAGHAVLILLLDAEQRPSRRALRQIMDQAPTLTRRNVAVVVVQAGSMTDEALLAWKQEAAVLFPVASLKGKPEDARSVWGAAALPWLIMADKAHRVVAEGFAVDELDAKMKTLDQ